MVQFTFRGFSPLRFCPCVHRKRWPLKEEFPRLNKKASIIWQLCLLICEQNINLYCMPSSWNLSADGSFWVLFDVSVCRFDCCKTETWTGLHLCRTYKKQTIKLEKSLFANHFDVKTRYLRLTVPFNTEPDTSRVSEEKPTKWWRRILNLSAGGSGFLSLDPGLERSIGSLVLNAHSIGDQTTICTHGFVGLTVELCESPFLRDEDLQRKSGYSIQKHSHGWRMDLPKERNNELSARLA